jgi:hypothetical protein
MIAAGWFVRSLTSNRRFRGWAAAGILLLACSVPALAGPADEIPVGDPLEAELRILDVRGDGSPTGLRLPRLHTRPLQIVELADSIASTRTDFGPSIRIARARVGRALVRDLPDTLGLPTAGSSRRLWSRTGSQDDRLDFSLGLEGRGNVQRGDAPHFSSGSGIRSRLGAGTGRWSAFVDLLFGRIDSAREFADPIVPGNDLVSQLMAASLAYTGDRGRWSFRLGRGQWHWGPGAEGSLLLSKTAPPITALSMRARIDFLHADGIAINGTLETAAGEQLAAHRLEWQAADGLRIGLAEAARYKSQAWQPLYLMGVIPYVLVQRLNAQDEPDSAVVHRNNVQISADVAWRIRPGLRTYGEILIDDLHARTGDIPNKLGFQFGIEGVTDVGNGRMTGVFEATRVSRYVYTSFFGRAFATQNQPLGWEQGPDALRLALQLGWDPDEAWAFGIRAAEERHGDSGLNDPFIPGVSDNQVDIWQFTPQMERTRELQSTARWWPRSGIDLSIGAGRRWIDDADHVAGVDRRETFGFLAVRLVR